jgi:drug/metabolite transporter (DMT)-like permease
MRTGDRPVLGIVYVNVGLVLMALNDALIRFLSTDYSPIQIAFVRTFVMAVAVGAVIVALRRYQLFVTKRLGLIALRGALSAVASTSFFFSLEYLELADAFTVGMAGPIFVAALSGWLLGERVPLARWAAILLGFAAIAFIMEPGEGLFNVWALLALLSAATYAVAMIIYRALTATEDSLTILFYMSLVAALVLLPLIPFVWTDMPLWELPLLLVVGVLAGVTQYLLVQAYRHAAANTVITFDYLSVIYVAIVGYLLFAEIPTWHVVLGAMLLIASGLYVVFDEARQQRRLAGELGE